MYLKQQLTVALGLLMLATPAFGKKIHPGLVSLGCFVEVFLDCDLAKAVMHVETGGDLKWAERIDSNGKYSRGVMQIQDGTAKAMGYKGNYRNLSTDPLEGFRYGLKYLNWQLRRYSKYSSAVAGYNAGSAYRCPKSYKLPCTAGQFVNQRYVDDVHRRYVWLKNRNQKIRGRYWLLSSYWDGSGSSTIQFRKDYQTLLAYIDL